MIHVAPELQAYVSALDASERNRTIRRCADLLRAMTARLIDPQLPTEILDELEGLLTSARTLASQTGSGDSHNVAAAEVHPWVGPSNAVAPPMKFHIEGDMLVGLVECSEVYSGRVARVHGGVIAGLFDAVVATRGALSGAPITVNLTVNYRRSVPLDRRLRMEAAVDRFDGRKCHVSARMLDAGVLLADATGILLPVPPPQEAGPP